MTTHVHVAVVPAGALEAAFIGIRPRIVLVEGLPSALTLAVGILRCPVPVARLKTFPFRAVGRPLATGLAMGQAP